MAHEPHPPPNTFPGLLLVDRPTLALHLYRLFNGTTRDADLVGNMHELFECEATIGRILNEVVEARSDIDDVPNFVTREPSLLSLRIHGVKSTWSGRSVSRQIDIDHIEIGQSYRTVPFAEMGRLLLIPGHAGTTGWPIQWTSHVALHCRNLGKASHDDPKIALHPVLLHNGRPALYH